MFDLLARMYRTGKIDDTGLQAAVDRGWITAEHRQEIIDTGGNVGVLLHAASTA